MWEGQKATREDRRKRAMGGMTMEIRKEMIEKGTKIRSMKKGIKMERMRRGKKKRRIIKIYVGKSGMKETLQTLKK